MASALLFPEAPVIRSVLHGLTVSLFVAIGFRATRTAKTFGLRFLTAVALLAVLTGLLMILGQISNIVS